MISYSWTFWFKYLKTFFTLKFQKKNVKLIQSIIGNNIDNKIRLNKSKNIWGW